jgi:hypothetical protein
MTKSVKGRADRVAVQSAQKQPPLLFRKPGLLARSLLLAGREAADSSRDNAVLGVTIVLGIIELHR